MFAILYNQLNFLHTSEFYLLSKVISNVLIYHFGNDYYFFLIPYIK